MKIDRARFLHLVAVIGGTACGSEQRTQAPVVPVETASAAPTTTVAIPRASSSPPIALEKESEPEAKPTAAPLLSIDDYDPRANHSCSELVCPGPTQEAFKVLRMQCSTYSQLFRPEYHQRFMHCMLRKNRTPDVCDLTLIHDGAGGCLEGWNRPKTIDPAAKAKCAGVVARCATKGKPLRDDVCERTLSVTSPRYETKMVHCIEEGCSATACYLVQ